MITMPNTPPITVNRVYRFRLNPSYLSLPGLTPLQVELHDDQDVLVIQDHHERHGLYRVEALDGAYFDALLSELHDDATTPAEKFAGSQP